MINFQLYLHIDIVHQSRNFVIVRKYFNGDSERKIASIPCLIYHIKFVEDILFKLSSVTTFDTLECNSLNHRREYLYYSIIELQFKIFRSRGSMCFAGRENLP